MTVSTDRQEYTFQTEIKQLLHLLSHSLYQNREITVRELVSNASDALDKLHFLRLTEGAEDDGPLEITLVPDKEARTLTIRDTGVGMTRDELVENLGTIAHSGSLSFLDKMTGDKEQDLSLIGQFGVGFYSAFMVADRVDVVTKSHTDGECLRWESDGTGAFTIEPADGETIGPHGTAIVLHLKEDFDEFTDPYRLEAIVKKYSAFVRHPIRLVKTEGADPEQLNEQRPIWVEPKSQLDDAQYTAFYQHLAHRTNEEPLWHLHLSSDSPLQFHAILYCPASNFERLGFGRSEHGIHLCAKRILVEDDNRHLLPEYLRFLCGLVDSDDLPLNVSRQALQDDSVFRKIRKVLVKKVLDHLAKFADEDAGKYATFVEEFGPVLREGVGSDWENRDRIAKLLRYHSTKVDDLTSLDAYLERAGDDAKAIYYATGTSVDAIRRNPNLELFRKRDVEVLLLDDPFDELVFNHLGKYAEKDLVSIDAADVDLPEAAEDESDETQEQSNPAPNLDKLLVLFRQALGDQVKDVRESKRLTDSACCLVNDAGQFGAQLQKILAANDDGFAADKRILEVNPSHPFVRRLGELVPNPDNEAFISDCARQLHVNAMLQEGVLPPTDAGVGRVQSFMEELARGRSSIVT